ncbi:MAG: hypothetical protein Q9204_004950 [Flavoplaca sp. TL-2023a]
MDYHGNQAYSSNWHLPHGLPPMQQRQGVMRAAVPQAYCSFDDDYGIAGRAPVAPMTPTYSQDFSFPIGYPMIVPSNGYNTVPQSSTITSPEAQVAYQEKVLADTPEMSGDEMLDDPCVPELYEIPSQLLNDYPARIDPPSLAEPRHIPLPKHNPSIVLALHPYDKAEVDSNYMGFIIVMERIWTQFLREYLEGFCRRQGHCSIRREVVDLEVRKELVRWASRAAVESDFPHQVEEARDAAHLEYEHRVRCWHVREHVHEYVNTMILRLRELGYLIGG